MTLQQTFWDQRIDEGKLGSYVYALIDPINNEVFYIGLAGGLNEQGNSRPNNHLLETKRAIDGGNKLTLKQTRIKEIWESNQKVGLKIVRRNLERNVAIHIEAALIDLLRVSKSLGNLTNIVSGHGSQYSLIDEYNLAEIIAESPNYTINNLWLFEISKAVENLHKTPFDAVVGDWIIADSQLKNLENEPQYAVGLIRGIAKVVIKINGYEIVEQQAMTRLVRKKRFCAEDISNNEDIGTNLLDKDFSHIVNGASAWRRNGGRLRVNLSVTEHKVTWGKAN